MKKLILICLLLTGCKCNLFSTQHWTQEFDNQLFLECLKHAPVHNHDTREYHKDTDNTGDADIIKQCRWTAETIVYPETECQEGARIK